jgi:N-acetylneuraminate lyase
MRGILPAVVTPFDGQGKFVPSSFERLLEHIYSAGVDGVYVCGQTGEGLLQSVEQRRRIAETAVKASPAGKTVVINVGAYTTDAAVELAKHAAGAGAQAISSLPPPGSYSFREIRAYYEAVAAATDLPMLVYYFPELCPAVTTAEQLLELCAIPNVIGLKFTDFDLYKMWLLRQGSAVVFNGRDEVLVAGLLVGADGGIGSVYNIVPDLFVELYSLARDGRWAEARAVQQTVNELIRIVLCFPVFPAIKTMLNWSGIDCGRCLPPRQPLTPEDEASLRDMLARSSFADRSFAGLQVR